MKFFGSVLAALALVSGVAQAHPTCNRFAIMNAAHTLSHAAEHFSDALQRHHGFTHLSADARTLSHKVEHLNRAVERTTSCEHIRRDFHEVEHAYQHLQTSLRRAHDAHHNRHVMHDFQHVTSAYQSLSTLIPAGGAHPPVLPPAVTTVNLTCQSDEHRQQICPAGGLVLNAQLIGQLSRRRCVQNVNWGFTGDSLWTRGGCRANFQVTIQR